MRTVVQISGRDGDCALSVNCAADDAQKRIVSVLAYRPNGTMALIALVGAGMRHLATVRIVRNGAIMPYLCVRSVIPVTRELSNVGGFPNITNWNSLTILWMKWLRTESADLTSLPPVSFETKGPIV